MDETSNVPGTVAIKLDPVADWNSFVGFITDLHKVFGSLNVIHFIQNYALYQPVFDYWVSLGLMTAYAGGIVDQTNLDTFAANYSGYLGDISNS